MHAKHIPMHIFRQRLIDSSQCLKLKGAFRQLRTLGELLVLINSSAYIYFYQRAVQRPTRKSHPRIDFDVAICLCCSRHTAISSASLPRVKLPPYTGKYTHSFSIPTMLHSFSPALMNTILTIIMK